MSEENNGKEEYKRRKMDSEALDKLTSDLREAVITMNPRQARFLVDCYYQMQDNRIRADGQIRSMEDPKNPKNPEPHKVLDWLSTNAASLENQVKLALSDWSQSRTLGRWAEANIGIGPVISAGLMAFIAIEICPTVGHIYRYAGLDPTVIWWGTEKCLAWVQENGGASDELIIRSAGFFGRRVETVRRFATTDMHGDAIKMNNMTLAKALSRRPWNASLKTLCWKIGQSFIKQSGKEDSVYGQLYNKRSIYEEGKNAAKDYQPQALRIFEAKPNHKQRKTYKEGLLPDGHLLSREARYATKIFLSHWWEQAYWLHFGSEPPKPFAIAHLGHAHYIEPEVPIQKRKDEPPPVEERKAA